MTAKVNINQVRGRVVSDVELKTLQINSGEKKVLQFRFMYGTLQKTDKNGSHANFIQVEAWGKTAEKFATSLEKGTYIQLNGCFVQKRYVNKHNENTSMFIFMADYISILKESKDLEIQPQEDDESKNKSLEEELSQERLTA